jgi:Uma2 family endonuclease
MIRIPSRAATRDGFTAWATSAALPENVRLSYLNQQIVLQIVPDVCRLEIPARAVATLDGFCDWATSDAYPERGRFSFLNHEVLIDMSPEELETHNKVKTEVVRAIANLNEQLDLGEVFSDGTLVKNEKAGLSTEPDGTLVTWETSEAGRVCFEIRKDRQGQYLELQGTPDWVLEVVSRSSVKKDTHDLRGTYHRAGIGEYWLIDAQEEDIVFQILVRRRTRYVAVTARDGWYPSPVFGRSFRLERRRNRAGRWQYKLHVKPA